MALRRAAVRPSLRDLLVILGASAIMAALVRPLNNLPAHWLGALLAALLGGAIIGAGILVFDVAGLRRACLAFARPRNPPGAALAPMKP